MNLDVNVKWASGKNKWFAFIAGGLLLIIGAVPVFQAIGAGQQHERILFKEVVILFLGCVAMFIGLLIIVNTLKRLDLSKPVTVGEGSVTIGGKQNVLDDNSRVLVVETPDRRSLYLDDHSRPFASFSTAEIKECRNTLAKLKVKGVLEYEVEGNGYLLYQPESIVRVANSPPKHNWSELENGLVKITSRATYTLSRSISLDKEEKEITLISSLGIMEQYLFSEVENFGIRVSVNKSAKYGHKIIGDVLLITKGVKTPVIMQFAEKKKGDGHQQIFQMVEACVELKTKLVGFLDNR